MGRLRLIVRDVALGDAIEQEGAAGAPRESEHPLVPKTTAGIAVMHIDFGPEAIRESLAATAEDERQPLAARMQSLLAAAIVDGVYGEHPAALAKLERVLGYYQNEKNLLMQAVTVNAMGEVCQLGAALDQAQHWFECALALAVESESALALATVAKNLGSLCFSRGDFASAAQYFDAVVQIAPKMLDNETKSWALEQRGASEAELDRHPQAVQTWREGADFCRDTDHVAGQRAHLARLRDAYARAGLLHEQRLAEQELRTLGGGPAHA
jgi:tetratricopeptide (TPR) repeat protein